MYKFKKIKKKKTFLCVRRPTNEYFLESPNVYFADILKISAIIFALDVHRFVNYQVV